MKVHGDYDWLERWWETEDGCFFISYDSSKLYNIIKNNQFNQEPKVYVCEKCKTVLRPKQGDCCVYCSYGTVKCPPIQAGDNCC